MTTVSTFLKSTVNGEENMDSTKTNKYLLKKLISMLLEEFLVLMQGLTN